MRNNYDILYEAKLDLIYSESEPDVYNSSIGRPPLEFVVSRKIDGTPVSRYEDYEWDWSAYVHDMRCSKLNFCSWCADSPNEDEGKVIADMQWLMFMLIWVRNCDPLSYARLCSYMCTLRKLALFSVKKQLTILSVLSSDKYVIGFLKEVGSFYAKNLSVLIGLPALLGEKTAGFNKVKSKTIEIVVKHKSKYDESNKQHSLIPSGIYSSLLDMFSRELEEFEKISTQYMNLILACSHDLDLGRCINIQYKNRSTGRSKGGEGEPLKPDLDVLLEHQYDLKEYFYSRGIAANIKSISAVLTQIQFCAKQLIHAYTGARDSEVKNLPYHCLDEFYHSGSSYSLILGTTTKFNHGRPTSARWVTSNEGVRAVKVAQCIADMIYQVLGDKPKKSLKGLSNYPLFISCGYLPVFHLRHIENRRYRSGGLKNCNMAVFIRKQIPVIEIEDIHELELIDIHRSWSNEEEYNIGMPWPLKTHQFRRSLAIYASKSGLVSLPSLRRQLQQITNAMASYYSRGSHFAKNIINFKSGFGHEYQQAQPESEALSYMRHVLLSDERLFGGHGAWLSKHDDVLASGVITQERKVETLRRFERGELSYKETILGGCMEPGPCDKKALRSIVGCLDCKSAGIKVTKLKIVIADQKRRLAALDKLSMEWRAEKSDLEALRSAYHKYKID